MAGTLLVSGRKDPGILLHVYIWWLCKIRSCKCICILRMVSVRCKCMYVCLCVGLADGSRSSIVLMDVDTDGADALLVSRGQRQDEEDDVVVDEWQMVVDDGWNVGGLLAYLLMMTIRSTRWLPNKN